MEIKSFIQQKLNTLLSEARIHEHFLVRLKERFIDVDSVEVGYEISGSVGQYKKVGTFKMPQSVKDQVMSVYEKLIKTNFPKSQSFGVLIANIPINPQQVNFHITDLSEIKGKTLVIVDEKSNSNGNVVWLIIRENEVETIYYGKSYVPQTPEKMRVTALIKNLDKYTPR